MMKKENTFNSEKFFKSNYLHFEINDHFITNNLNLNKNLNT